jgi:hypothetical protein
MYPSGANSFQCAEGTLVGKYNFYPYSRVNFDNNTINNTPGYYFYTCAEKFSPEDPFYKNLLAQTWVACGNTNNINLVQCSIKIQKPPIVRFIVQIPPPSMEANNNPRSLFFTRGMFWVQKSQTVSVGYNSQLDFRISNTTGSNQTSNSGIYTWAYDGSATPNVSNVYTNIYWMLAGIDWSGTNYQSDAYSNGISGGILYGHYYCSYNILVRGGPAYGFPLLFNDNLFGATCTVTCGGPWVFVSKFDGTDSWLSNHADVRCEAS